MTAQIILGWSGQVTVLRLSIEPFPHPLDSEAPNFAITGMEVDEEEKVTFLTSMMGDGDPEIARRVLRKHNGDMQKAATSILEGDTGVEDPWPADFGSFTDASTSVTLPSTPPRQFSYVLSVVQTLSLLLSH
jgi:hypothetical protein